MNSTPNQLSAVIRPSAQLWFVGVLMVLSSVFAVSEIPGGEAEDAVPVLPVPMILLDNELLGGDVLALPDGTQRAVLPPPHAPAKPGAFILRWQQYRTLVVIDDSAGLVKACWIVTLTTMPETVQTPRGEVVLARGQVVVAYRGQAFYDQTGTLQIDANRAKLSGALWDNWSPDSFSIGSDKQVFTRDDDPSHPANTGEIEKEVSAEKQPAEYRKLWFAAQAIINGNV